MVTDTQGLPLALAVHPADVPDRDGLALVCTRSRRRLPWLHHLFADGGYRGVVAAAADAHDGYGSRSSTAPGASGFAVLPRRWVIERSFAWLSRNRRLAKDFEQLTEAATAMVVVAIIQLLIRRLASPGSSILDFPDGLLGVMPASELRQWTNLPNSVGSIFPHLACR